MTTESLTAKDVIEAASRAWTRFEAGTKRGQALTPWNELEHWRPRDISETEYVSQTLSMVRNWARKNSVHVWIVAHPAKMRREDGKLPIPKPDMISGSQGRPSHIRRPHRRNEWMRVLGANLLSILRNPDSQRQDQQLG